MGRCLLSKDDSDAYSIGFGKVFGMAKGDCSKLEVVIDWSDERKGDAEEKGPLYQQRSDAEANGPCKAVGDIVANRLLKGCQVHWAKSYQRVPDKVYRTAEEKMAYNRIASCIRTLQQVQG